MTKEQKLEIAKKILESAKEEKENFNENLMETDNKFIGKTLESQEKQLNKWIDEANVEIEAFELLIAKLNEPESL